MVSWQGQMIWIHLKRFGRSMDVFLPYSSSILSLFSRELAELIGQVKPQVASKEDIEQSGLEVFKASQLSDYETTHKVASNTVERVCPSFVINLILVLMCCCPHSVWFVLMTMNPKKMFGCLHVAMRSTRNALTSAFACPKSRTKANSLMTGGWNRVETTAPHVVRKVLERMTIHLFHHNFFYKYVV